MSILLKIKLFNFSNLQQRLWPLDSSLMLPTPLLTLKLIEPFLLMSNAWKTWCAYVCASGGSTEETEMDYLDSLKSGAKLIQEKLTSVREELSVDLLEEVLLHDAPGTFLNKEESEEHISDFIKISCEQTSFGGQRRHNSSANKQ